MNSNALQSIQTIFLDVDKRAERASDDILEETFVDFAPLYDLLSTRNNQVIYGRRGTGKTHALKYLAKQISEKNELPIYIDLRSIGSNGSIYGDPSRTLSERASTLIRDVLNTLLHEFYQVAYEVICTVPDPTQVTIRLDDLSRSISEIKVSGEVEQENTIAGDTKIEKGGGFELNLGAAPTFIGSGKLSKESSTSHVSRTKQVGSQLLHVNFGSVSLALTDWCLCSVLLAYGCY